MEAKRWQEIKRIYESALELPADRRGGFLDERCAGDESLRQQVESFLECRPAAEEFMKSPACEGAAPDLAGGSESPADLTGITLLHYSVTRKIGEGGMGQVYQADDLKLNRPVALKVLPEAFARDPERLARFEREARLLASLNHPNIAAIYGLEEVRDKRFLVLELVEGETLAQRIKKRPLPGGEAVEVCRQIAEGLEAAHEKGIVHRDLKPANIAITREGKVKILDFGLGRALRGRESSEDLPASPADSETMTGPGIVLGTAAYMSPEQAKGKAVDKRADIWAFGCVLYECLTGSRAFQGETISEVVASILKSEPDWALLPAETPARVRSLLRRCLQKDPGFRLRDIGDAWLEMEEPAAASSETLMARRRFPLVRLAACAVVLLLAGILTDRVWMKYFQPAPSASVVKTAIKVEPGHWLEGRRRPAEAQRPSRTAMAISSDGRFVVYSAIDENPGPQAKPQLYLRRMDQVQAGPILGTEGGINPFLSPDNRWVGFWVEKEKKLKKVSIDGGVPTTLCDVALIFGANWGPDNSIVFAGDGRAGLSRVSADGGHLENLTTPDPKREEDGHRLPSWLPDGKAVLFTITKHLLDSQPQLALFRLDTRKWHVLLNNAADARYVSTGHLVFLQQGILMAVRFDPARLEVIGQPIPLVENVMQAFASSSNYHTVAGQ
ncbi:MAG: serine/threonine-protein kinase, partial [Methanothrix sp.]|nr:serine/threonine-protein kinase [Methanothrix sp.]